MVYVKCWLMVGRSGGSVYPQCKWCKRYKWCMHMTIMVDDGGVEVYTPSVKGVNGVNGVRIMLGDGMW